MFNYHVHFRTVNGHRPRLTLHTDERNLNLLQGRAENAVISVIKPEQLIMDGYNPMSLYMVHDDGVTELVTEWYPVRI